VSESAQPPRKPNPPTAPSLDSVTTIDDDGSRRFLFPSDVKGRFSTQRIIAAVGLIAIYLALPIIQIGGYPAIFLDISTRRFHLFGFTLAAQDAWLLFFLITGLGFTLFLVTALLGRIWCGWACPHSVFLDQVYRRIERLIDGDARSRRRLAAAPLSGTKLVKRIVKHGLYLLVSAAIVHLLLAYFVSLPALWAMMSSSPSDHLAAFVFMIVSTGILYFNFAWFREQLCIVICPYGRLQSALIDDNSLVIGYDAKRGEPRGKLGAVGAGDCVACNRCVQVCPTGIDIRQGLQMECIACSACVDACDDVMDRVKKPRGLIRYDSVSGLAGKPTHWIRPRTVIYTLLFVAGAVVSAITFLQVKPASFAITRIVGTPYVVDAQNVRNQFMVRIVNKRPDIGRYVVSVKGAAGIVQAGFEGEITLPAMAEEVRPLVLSQNRAVYNGPFEITLKLSDAARTFELERKAEFLGPDAELLKEDDREKGIRR
jgi:cytochrome c oxidase accessory protein FixG